MNAIDVIKRALEASANPHNHDRGCLHSLPTWAKEALEAVGDLETQLKGMREAIAVNARERDKLIHWLEFGPEKRVEAMLDRIAKLETVAQAALDMLKRLKLYPEPAPDSEMFVEADVRRLAQALKKVL